MRYKKIINYDILEELHEIKRKARIIGIDVGLNIYQNYYMIYSEGNEYIEYDNIEDLREYINLEIEIYEEA